MNKDSLSWDIYRTFLSVLEEGSLSGAARALGLTQPTIGRHIDALETSLGYQLFTRSQLGLMPTEAAFALQPYAQGMASTAQALRRAASAQGATISGTVRISASEVIGIEILPPILSRLMIDNPGLKIELSLSNELADLLRRDADIAVRMTEPTQDALIVKRIGGIELGLHGHESYLARRGTPKTIADLKTHTIIGYDTETPAIRAMRKRIPALDGIDFTFACDSDLAQRRAVVAGLGIGFSQVKLAQAETGLKRVLPDVSLNLSTFVVMHENLKTTPRCRATFDALVAGLQAYVG